MSFLNPYLLLGVLGVALPILAHLLNRYQVKRTDWAAMRFLNRRVRIRSRQLKLRDILLLILRCLALLFLVVAVARPAVRTTGGVAAAIGEPRAAVMIALDASFSMRHAAQGGRTRFDRAREGAAAVAQGIRPGDPVTLVLLGGEHRVAARNMAFNPERFDALLEALAPTYGTLDVDSVPRLLNALAADMKAPQKEIYIITDMQAQDWTPRSAWLDDSLKKLSRNASVFVVPVTGDADNLAITGLELVSGVLRKGTSARYRATVRNGGATVSTGVRVNGLINNISVDTKVIPTIAPGVSETVSLVIPFRDSGPVRIAGAIGDDALAVDNTRRAVAVVRDRLAVLIVEGATQRDEGAAALIGAALRASGRNGEEEDLNVQTVSWVDLPGQELRRFDVVVLSDVPDITVEQAAALEQYVREGNGLVWFGGENVKADAWNQRSARGGTPLLPAVIHGPVRTGNALGTGRPLDPSLPDHPVCRPLHALPVDLLSETRFHSLLKVEPAATSVRVLALAGSDAPVLLEHALGRGAVFMFTTTAGPVWNNMAVTPVFPMLLQQMVTYLTAREFETPRRVGDSLSLSYMDQPDATEAVFDTPSGETMTVPVREHRDRYVALLGNAGEPGFYLARVSLQAAGMPVAVNVDTKESTVACLTAQEAAERFAGTGIRILNTRDELLTVPGEIRTNWSLWRVCMLAGLLFFVLEGLLAEWSATRMAGPGNAAEGTT